MSSSFILHPSSFKSAFTLTEILIVIAILVLLLALAVPAFNLISGNRSIEGAANTLSAVLGRARAQAIGLQKTTGVLFFLDNRTGRQSFAIVQEVDAPAVVTAPQRPDVWLDLLESDIVALPPGVGAQLVNDSQFVGATTTRASDGYAGYNSLYHDAVGTLGVIPLATLNGDRNNYYGGVILFDGNGRLVSLAYGFRGTTVAGGWSPLGQLIFAGTSKAQPNGINFIPWAPAAGGPPNNASLPHSQFGLVMYEQQQFVNNTGLSESNANADGKLNYQSGTNYSAQELAEETWLDQNATPFMVNRYNGTLIKGE